MNKIFKIVFNAARGKMMVVNEATSSVQTGKKVAVTVAVIGALAAGSAVAAERVITTVGADGVVVSDVAPTGFETKNTVWNPYTWDAYAGVAGYYEGTGALEIKDSKYQNFTYLDDGKAGAYGTVINVKKSTTTMNNVEFSNNNATSQISYVQGIFKQTGGTLEAENLTFSNNTGGRAMGLAVAFDSVVATIKNSTFENNVDIETTKDTYGAAVAFVGSNVTFENVKFIGNKLMSTQSYGGAIHASYDDSFVTVKDSYFKNNSAAVGGALSLAGSSKGAVIENTVFKNNTAYQNGGAIRNASDITFKGTNTFVGNTANGVANDIYNVGTITLAEGSVLSLAGGINGEGGVLDGSGSIVVTDAGATIEGQSVADSITASATGDVNDALGGNVSKLESNLGGVTVTGMEEGNVMGAVTVGADGTVETQVNKKTEALADKVTLAPQMITRIMMNDLRKRMGDVRAGEGTHGAWARYNGGQMAGDGIDSDFHMVQVGIDTVPVVGAPRFGVAFSYAQTEADDAYGTTDMDSYSLAFYGTKMYDNGMFVDVIGRMATMDTDIVNAGMKAKMDNVALSLSGEFGWRFDVTDSFFVEPSVEATYTYTNADTFTMGSGTYELEATDSLVARAGFAAGFKCPANKGDVYVRAAVVHEFMGDTTMNSRIGNVYAAPVETDGEDTWFEYAIGANFNINKNTYVYADVERTEGATMDEDWRANVGVRFAF